MNKIFTYLKVIAIPVAYGLILRYLFGVEDWQRLYSVMSLTFLVCLPTIMGILTIFFSSEEKAKERSYRFFAPWVPILFFFVLTLLVGWEGWACWLMVLPLFFLAASLGGFIGWRLKNRNRNKRVYLSTIPLIPLLITPLEMAVGSIPGTYQAYTFIDIQAPAEKIWSNVTRVKEIKKEQDTGWLTNALGFPRPVKAILNYEGVGAYREAIFTNGLVFHETVSEYIPQKKMVFSIKAYPHEIPSTTLDEHVVIGGKYFDVLNGTYELEKLNSKTYRLHLYSHFKLTTTFNFYASWWARWIMQDIQDNILQVEKYRAENE
ncbi:hypothetical protein [Siphonobacter sp. SORGH_AS_1065]|uniref:hypothetical protein n=1 Tax=Siphonobacter sp. SORGH_AS_1065 TaxID=3041795 RepID=UPI0027819C48|nr:hypothetical protein [Siphonobacter sp. SORGH_AS_1065]MDQ1086486.1 amino acid transporter [Siphonobacter sp. SORGH_AS_1065]